jgi:predicted nucleotidyltransferase
MQQDEMYEHVRAVLSDYPIQVNLAYIFGSVASKLATKESDIDIAIQVANDELNGHLKLALCSALAEIVNRPVDLETALRLKNAVGFRNIAVHCYDDVNLNVVFAICSERLSDFTSFAKEVWTFVDK